MLLTIWRHGEAGDASTDRYRRLTAKGKRELRHGSEQFAQQCAERLQCTVQSILYSPWQRTTESAAIIRNAFPESTCEVEEALRPGAAIADVDALLGDIFAQPSPPQHLVFISHQPLVSRLIDAYLDDAGRVPPLSPGGLTTLELNTPGGPGCAQLRVWALPPTYEPNR